MKTFYIKLLLILILLFIVIYIFSYDKKKKIDDNIPLFIPKNKERKSSNIIETDQFIMYNHTNNHTNPDYKKRYEFLVKLNKDNQKQKELEKQNYLRKERMQREHAKRVKMEQAKRAKMEHAKRVKMEQVKKVKMEQVKKVKMENPEIESDSNWKRVKEVKEVKDVKEVKEVEEVEKSYNNNPDQLINNYPKYDKKYNEEYKRPNKTLLTEL